MPGKKERWICPLTARQELERLVKERLEDYRVVERARILLAYLNGMRIDEIATRFQVSRSMIFRWRSRFMELGVAGLRDKPRSGKPPKYARDFERRVLETIVQPPPDGAPRWDGATLARELGASDDAVWRVLRRQGISLARQRVWHIRTEVCMHPLIPEIVGLFIAPPVWIAALRSGEQAEGEARLLTRDRRAGNALHQAEAAQGILSLEQALAMMAAQSGETLGECARRAELNVFLEDILAGCRPGQRLLLHVVGSADSLGIAGWMAAHTDARCVFYITLPDALAALEKRVIIRQPDGAYIPLVRYVVNYPADAQPFIWRKSGIRVPAKGFFRACPAPFPVLLTRNQKE